VQGGGSRGDPRVADRAPTSDQQQLWQPRCATDILPSTGCPILRFASRAWVIFLALRLLEFMCLSKESLF
jgi:hypothetical protein